MKQGEPLDIESLRRRVIAGWTPRFLFFWGHSASGAAGHSTSGAAGRSGDAPDGPPGKACLSQWYPAEFVVDGVRYPTAEHFMMHRKAQLFGDEDSAARILESGHPGEAKALGRQVRGFDEDRWEEHRVRIVVAGSHAKFSQNAELRAFLRSTRERVLVEASPNDTVWGIGLAEKDPRSAHPARWRGLNLLGFALMEARAMLAAEAAGS